ncbi:MAG TPA: DUF5670 family protein, partial [Candidatus Acidoferrales bacterium]|nr:DUF5670 family protein [Candidatus Acidoferrales bacterium]
IYNDDATAIERDIEMFWTFSVIFLSLWLVGISTPSTLHGYIHILLALAVATTVVPIIWRRKQPVD